jgi:hypothetical protein
MDATATATTEKHLTHVGWGAGITIGHERASALTLPRLLVDGYLNATVLGLMAECIQTEVNNIGPTHVRVCGTLFATKATQLARLGEEPPNLFRRRFIDPVEKIQWEIMYFPLFWPKPLIRPQPK